MNNNTPTNHRTQLTEQEFLCEIERLCGSMVDDDAVGEVRVYTNAEENHTILTHDEINQLTGMDRSKLMEHLRRYQTIVFDGGSKHGDLWKATCYPQSLIVHFVIQEPRIYTVIGLREDSGQILSQHIQAMSEQEAFYWAAKRSKNLLDWHDMTFIAAIPGELADSKDIFFPGEGTVCLDTILETFTADNHE
jgi:hypothetical protein